MDPAINTHVAFAAGVPRAHQRPTIRGGQWVQRADRPNDMAWRTTVRAAWLSQVGVLAWDGPVKLTAIFYGGSGDLDNLQKAVGDALGARGWADKLAPVYLDDRQVKWWDARSVPALRGQPAGVRIWAERLPNSWPDASC